MQENGERARKTGGRRDIVKVSGTQEAQRRAWRKAAAAAKMPLASWLREAADAATLTGITAADLRAEIQRLRADLTRGVGNNLNQLVQGMHLRRQAGDAEDDREVAHRLRGIAAEVAAIRQDAGALLRRVEPARRRRDR